MLTNPTPKGRFSMKRKQASKKESKKRRVLKKTPHDILCTHGLLLSSLQRGFLRRQMGTDTETYSQTLSREWDLGILSPKWDVSVKFLPLEMGNPKKEETERVWGPAREDGGHQESEASEWTWAKRIGTHRDWSSRHGPHGSAPGPVSLYLVFLWDSWMCQQVGLIPVPSFGLFSLCWFMLSNFNEIVFVLSYCILPCYYFLMNEWMKT